jgi:hypothetical protein
MVFRRAVDLAVLSDGFLAVVSRRLAERTFIKALVLL